MPKTFKKIALTSLILTAAIVAGSFAVSRTSTASEAITLEDAKDPAVERARREVRMLDDIYKTAIVLVTENYVHDDTDLAAGSAFKALFEASVRRAGTMCVWSMRPGNLTAI